MSNMNVVPAYKGMTVEQVKGAIKRYPFSVAMYNPSYGINMGAVLRSCNAFAAQEYICVGKKKFDRRGSLGVQNYENIQHFPDWKSSLNWMRQQKYLLVGVDYVEGISVPIHELEAYPGHPVFILGNERDGLPSHVLNEADLFVHIEQFGSIPSLNVAQAATVIMNHWHDLRRRNEQQGDNT